MARVPMPLRSLSDFVRPASRNSSFNDECSTDSYSLKTSAPSAPSLDVEALTDRLFSLDHLKIILREPLILARFQNFLASYRPRSALSLRKYLDVQKAIAAVNFANSLADNLWPGLEAAPLDPAFESKAKNSVEDLLNDALPGYITHNITELVTELLQREITGQNSPATRQMVNGLAEVYCLTDPSLPDNPIVYASNEFFNSTQYDQTFVIGRNCRFLQRQKTSRDSIDRLVEALSEGKEICDIILNYRRDGDPFLNLLLIAPLYDDKGIIRYFLGAQVDINGLVEDGRCLESFSILLQQDRCMSHINGKLSLTPKAALAELSGYLNEQERNAIQNHGERLRGTSDSGSSRKQSGMRRMIGMQDIDNNGLWPAPRLGPNGRLPGVFQNYFLVRHYPSLRIIFTSPSLRVPGLVQSKFMSRIRGPQHVRKNILHALAGGESFTAKVGWITHIPTSELDRGSRPSRSPDDDEDAETAGPAGPAGSMHGSGSVHEGRSSDGQEEMEMENGEGEEKARWIHCTPMIGKDRNVGVWMVVFV